MIFVTSDTHFCHSKSFIYEPRGFKNVDEMNEKIILNWNNMVTPDDIVYHLGDVMLNNNEKGLNCLKRLNGKIILIRGNHCTDSRIELYKTCPNVIDAGKWADILKYKGYTFYLSHYPTLTGNHDENKPLKRQIINLCGHTHTVDKFADIDKGLIYHCELDAHNNCPVPIDMIITDIENKHYKMNLFDF